MPDFSQSSALSAVRAISMEDLRLLPEVNSPVSNKLERDLAALASPVNALATQDGVLT